jgi:hypothetical protein
MEKVFRGKFTVHLLEQDFLVQSARFTGLGFDQEISPPLHVFQEPTWTISGYLSGL